jgi:hypothetical protein
MISVFKFASCILVVCTTLVGGVQTDSIDFFSKKDVFLEKLDSIDMEKQIRKRKGQSLEELEKNALIIKDSIAACKTNINRENSQPAPHFNESGNGTGFFQNIRWVKNLFPHNLFDWIVGIVAGIAILAGFILTIGIISILRGAIKDKKKPPLKTSDKTESPPLEKKIPSSIDEFNGNDSDHNKERIESLRKRMSEESQSFPAPSERASVDEPFSPVELKKLIIKAALDGADTLEISRKFHVSTDHVSLILRIARQESDKNL